MLVGIFPPIRHSDQRVPTNVAILLDFHSTKQGLSLVDIWSRGLD